MGHHRNIHSIPVAITVSGGIRIGRGTQDKIQFEVNDDLQALTILTCRVIGYKHFP